MTAGDQACAAALTALPGMGPARLARLLRTASPSELWSDVRSGRLLLEDGGDQSKLDLGAPKPRRARTWRDIASRKDADQWWAVRAEAGVQATWYGAPTYPTALLGDPYPPAVMFWRGSIECLERPCVAIVGTRNASPDGRAVAFEMGRDLAAAGVCVVSGLALGIDGAAHMGAVEAQAGAGAAGPVGVAASGVDVPYPLRHRSLWERVVQTGAIISEALPGWPAEAWRFPFRNRIIAGLSRLVVVVESHAAGGSLITAEAALERGIEVRVVPGPVRSPASAGSNQLLYDGPGPVRNGRDVLDAIGLIRPDPGPTPGSVRVAADLDPVTRSVLDAVGWQPRSLGEIVAATGMSIPAAARAVEALEAKGWLHGERGWWTRVAPR